MKPTPIVSLLADQEEYLDENGVRWRTLPGKPRIRVSEKGQVQFWDRRKRDKIHGLRDGNWKLRSTWIDPNTGKLRTSDRDTTRFVHRLVAQAFLGEKAWRRPISFVNGDVSDPRVENLCVVINNTKNSNRKTRTTSSGPRQKLVSCSFSDVDAQKLIDEWHAGNYDTYQDAADALGLLRSTVQQIVRGSARPHLDRPSSRRFLSRRYKISQLRALMADWNSGKFQHKKHAAEAHGVEKTFAVRLLKGTASEHIYRVVDRPVR